MLFIFMCFGFYFIGLKNVVKSEMSVGKQWINVSKKKKKNSPSQTSTMAVFHRSVYA